ncbi:unnamed protein product [Spirodela intermedia]|uniref:K-box domain-containing protein n=1 Tax=Spirodela intermedia TaxID=51605 RepID=A0A7I8IFC8_SPIIN|nr:unnamed protein product [Spirodela intermedia]CAA6656399.1 unnamed protein product [Spirodela intermedia]
MGEELDDLDMNQLRSLEEDLETCLDSIRERKIKQIVTQTETYKKKVKSSEDQHRILIRQLVFSCSPLSLTHSLSLSFIRLFLYLPIYAGDGQRRRAPPNHIYGFRVQPSHPNLQVPGYGIHELRLA